MPAEIRMMMTEKKQTGFYRLEGNNVSSNHALKIQVITIGFVKSGQKRKIKEYCVSSFKIIPV